MAFYIPTIQSEVMLSRMLSSKTLQALLASGSVDGNTLDAIYAMSGSTGGDFINIPRYTFPDFQYTDIDSASNDTPTAYATVDDVGVVVRRHAPVQWKRSDGIRSGEAIDQIVSNKAGDKLAKQIVVSMLKVLNGAIDAMSGTAHTLDLNTGKITVAQLLAARSLLGDEAERLTTIVMHPKVAADILADLNTYYQGNAVVGTSVAVDGRLNRVAGLNVIETELVPTADGTFSTDGDDTYSTFLLTDQALTFGYQTQPEVETDKNILTPSTTAILKVSLDFLVHLNGVKYTAGTKNPTDAALGTSGNWGVAYADHREVGAIKIKSYAS